MTVPPAVNQPTKPTTVAVNLLDQDEFAQTAIGKVMLWALSIGRYIVVFTELIVILSFLSRFKLDRDLTDLNEAIARQKAIILSYNTLETDFKHVQDQLAIIRQVENFVAPPELITLLSRTMPTDVKLVELNVTDQDVQVSAISLSAQSLIRFLHNLEQSGYLTNLSVTDVVSQDEGLTISYTLSGSLKKPLAASQ